MSLLHMAYKSLTLALAWP